MTKEKSSAAKAKGTHGGLREGQGRPTTYEEGAMVVGTANITAQQAARMRALGGGEWLRATLDQNEHADLGIEEQREVGQDLIAISFRITESQREKLRELGGALWLRNVLSRSVAAVERNADESAA